MDEFANPNIKAQIVTSTTNPMRIFLQIIRYVGFPIYNIQIMLFPKTQEKGNIEKKNKQSTKWDVSSVMRTQYLYNQKI